MTKRSHPCAGWDEDLSALIDGELEAARRGEVEAHATSCARCGAQLDALRAVDARLAEIPLPEIAGRLSAPQIAGGAVEPAASEGEAPPTLRAVADSASRPRTPPAGPEPRRAAWKTSAAMRIATAAGVVLALFWLLERGRESTPSRDFGENPVSLEATSDEELALALELETAQDFEVIANLELLERLVDLGLVDPGLVDPEGGRG